jgi:large subunit ribosomal protein L25
MQKHLLNVETRTEFGKNASYRLRSQGYIPAVMYSHGKSESLKVLQKDFFRIFRGHVSESMLLDITITNRPDDKQHQVFIKEYQLNPVTDEVTHLDLFKITEGEKIQTNVPVIITGTAKGVRGGGILEFVERELEIECLPSEIPEKIAIDVTNLEIGHSIHISDLPRTGSLRFMGDDARVVVTILAPTKVVEEVPAVEAAAVEGEAAAGEKKKEEEKKEEKKKEEK